MNRLKFTVLIGMMLLSVIGIIWVQIIWIRNAVTIQNDSFNNSVAISLNDARKAIEFSRNVNFLNNFLANDPEMTGTDSEGVEFRIQSYSSQRDSKSLNITDQTIEGRSDSARITT